MKASTLKTLRVLALLFLFPGMGGLFYSAYLSTSYLESLPRMPDPTESRMIPREIHGTVVFQNEAENRRLTLCETTSVAIFVVGLVLGVVYLEKWAALRSSEGEERNGYASRQ